MKFDQETGRIINENEIEIEKDIIASIYDANGNYYLIGKNKKVFLKKDDGQLMEINDEDKIAEILHMFRPGRTDVV